MKQYHMQIMYEAAGWVGYYDQEYLEKLLLPWTNIEDAPMFEEMKELVPKPENRQKDLVLMQWIRMIADDGEHFVIGHNVVNNYPHKINHLHRGA